MAQARSASAGALWVIPYCWEKCSWQRLSCRASFRMGEMSAPGHWLYHGKDGAVLAEERETALLASAPHQNTWIRACSGCAHPQKPHMHSIRAALGSQAQAQNQPHLSAEHTLFEMTTSHFADEIILVPKARGTSHTCTHSLHHPRQKAYSWCFTPVKGQGRVALPFAKVKGCLTWPSNRCIEKQQLPAWLWRFAIKEQLPSSEDGALERCRQPHSRLSRVTALLGTGARPTCWRRGDRLF